MVPRFGGRNIEIGEWVYGHLFYFDDGRHFISPTGTDVVGGYGGAPAKYRLENLVCFEIKPETVGQSTGLKDKNGVEIYQDDVVYMCWSDEIGESHWGKITIKNPFDYCIEEARYLIHADELEVIGDIYENPEFLEVE